MAREMSLEELQDYMPVHVKNAIFVKEWAPKGYFHRVTREFMVMDDKHYVFCDTTVYKREKDKDLFVCNASALECISTNSSEAVEALRFCETSSRGRAFSAFGIGIDVSMSSRDDVQTDVDYRGPKIVEDVKSPKVKPPSIEKNLKRMKIEYKKDDKTFMIDKKEVKGKSLTVIKRYGFTEIDGMFVCQRDDV